MKPTMVTKQIHWEVGQDKKEEQEKEPTQLGLRKNSGKEKN